MSKQKNQKQEEKLSIFQIMKNVRYVLSYAIKLDKFLVYIIIATFIVCGIIYALFETLFLKIFVDFLGNKEMNLTFTIALVIGGILIMGFGQTIEVVVENFARARLIKTTGKIQEDFIHKAADIDLICYDHKEYFDDFVLAASQAEDMIVKAIFSTAEICSNFATIGALAILISTINPVIAIFPVLGFIVNIITRFRITKLEYNFEIEQKRIMRKADYSKRVFYQPEYAKELKLSKIDGPLRRQMEEAIDEVSHAAKKIGIQIAVLSLINWIVVFTFLSFFCVPMYLGYLALVRHTVTLGDVTAMNNATNGVRNRLDGLNYALVDFQRVGQYAQRFRRFIDYKIKIEKQVGLVPVPEEKETLEIKNMSFQYEGATSATLKNINMTVKPGERVAIVGENGAGKTTFVKLLMRLYDVSEGSIEYGGHDIREYTTKDYRDIFGAVFQDFQIYGAILAENVAMDVVTKEDDKRIKDALALADFSKKLEKLENDIQTEMTREFSDDGTMLSGGESQKVAIARMFAKVSKLSIAILDEPSSALDPFAEYTLNKNMMENAKDASIIFISHRLSTTKDADCIYMFEHGEIIEQGSHKELMELNGKYAVMFERQAHYYQDEIA
jgi:ATP-binding cassette subfamily B protein